MTIIESVKEKQDKYNEALNIYNNAFKKLNLFNEKYVKTQNKNDRANKIFNDKDSSKKYFVTEQGILKEKNNDEKYDYCDITSRSGVLGDIPSVNKEMMHLPYQIYEPIPNNLDNNSDYLVMGERFNSNQPCSRFNQEFSINLPDTSNNRQSKTCSYILQDTASNNMTLHDDLMNVSLQECHIRSEDVGHDSYGLINSDENELTGTCVTGNSTDNIPNNKELLIKEKLMITTYKNNISVTLFKNGLLIARDPKDNPTIFNYDNNNSAEDIINNALWSSVNNGGTVNDKCHTVWGGTINNFSIDSHYNCNLK
tara:strand:+ start:6907 stop:7839 length:933 start_codon:yes stop_codon:yes gene_type:complete